MTGGRSAAKGAALILADDPQRAALRQVQETLDEKRNLIADADRDIEDLRDALHTFESGYHARLAPENQRHDRVNTLIRHLERWSDLLAAPPRPRRKSSASTTKASKLGVRLEERRQRELQHQAQQRQSECDGVTPCASHDEGDNIPRSGPDTLKVAYRALARKFHPDLARTEEERVRHGAMMSKINDLYRLGDFERLQSLAEQARGGEIEDPSMPVEAQLALLSERLEWFETVFANLQDERMELERSPTCELMRNTEQSAAAGRDLLDDIRSGLRERVNQAYRDVHNSIQRLEQEVAHHNRRQASPLRPRDNQSLEKIFDPLGNQHLVKLGLEQANLGSASSAAQTLGKWVEDCAESTPNNVILILLTYVAELSPLPIKGLEKFDDLAVRFAEIAKHNAPPPTLAPEPAADDNALLERCLVDCDDLVEFGVKRATASLVHLGLRFRNPDLAAAIALALNRVAVRRLFRRVLAVLGERLPCTKCDAAVFAVPLYRLRGLDALHATVCPQCGHMLASYRMPRGKDIQSVLNPAFVDYEIVSDWRLRLSRTSVTTQLVPHEVETGTVGDLKKRLHTEVFKKNGLDIRRGQLMLLQNDARVPERTYLSTLEDTTLVVRFTEDVDFTESDAVEMVRHRIRNRYR